MTAPEDDPNSRDEDYQGELNSSSSERAYRSFLRAYPKELRQEYGEEMARTFRDLRRRELESRGVRGLAMLWSRTLPELVFTALTERSTMLTSNFSRNAYLPARPVVVKKWGGISALVGGIMGAVAFNVGALFPSPLSLGEGLFWLFSCILALVGLYGTRAERAEHSGYLVRFVGAGAILATMSVIVGRSVSLQLSALMSILPVLLCILSLFGLYGTLAERSERFGPPGRLAAVGAVLVTVSVVFWLAMGSLSALAWLLAWQWTAVPYNLANSITLYSWLAGLALLAMAAFRARLSGGLNIMPLVMISLVLIGIFLAFLTTLGMPILVNLPFIGSALLGWFLLKNTGTDGLA